MNRFVVIVNYGDGYTYTATDTYPVLGESVEDIFCQIHDQWKSKRAIYDGQIIIGKQKMDVDKFSDEQGRFNTPTIMTVDEWYQW